MGAAVNAVLAQRLVRKALHALQGNRDPPPEQVEFLELSGIIGQQIYQPVGCDRVPTDRVLGPGWYLSF